MRIIVIILGLLIATEANAQRKPLVKFGDRYLVYYHVGTVELYVPIREFTEYTKLAALFIFQNKSRIWSTPLNREFD